MLDKFVFYSKSADKPPGKGTNEYVSDTSNYTDLQSIKNWRHYLSNFYISPFTIDDEEWNSVEHWYHASKFRNNKTVGPDYEYYKTFRTNGGKSWSKGDGASAWAAGQAGKPRKSGKIDRKSKEGEKLPEDVSMRKNFIEDGIAKKAMLFGFFAKFTQNSKLKKILLDTKDAELWHFVSRKKPEYWDHLMRVRKCIRMFDGKYDLSEISKFSTENISKFLT